eukprot:2777664-Amphidinium_carterae.1
MVFLNVRFVVGVPLLENPGIVPTPSEIFNLASRCLKVFTPNILITLLFEGTWTNRPAGDDCEEYVEKKLCSCCLLRFGLNRAGSLVGSFLRTANLSCYYP